MSFAMRRTALVIAVVAAAAACGSSPGPTSPGPAPAVHPLAGSATWRGMFRIDSCVATREGCPFGAGSLIEFTLRSVASGTTLIGVFETNPSSQVFDLPVEVAGELQSDGSARLSGSYNSEHPAASLQGLDVQELVLRPDDRAGLAGTVILRQRRETFTRTTTGTIVSAARTPFADAAPAFQGAFDGFGTIRACEGACQASTPGARATVSLRVTQTGSGVRGEYGNGVPVIGTASGNSLTLTGELRAELHPDFGTGATLVRLESFSATVDALGRLSGSLRLYSEGMLSGNGSSNFRPIPFTQRVDLDLTTVIRQ